MKAPPILVAGMSAGGVGSLSQSVIARIDDADLLVGGRRHLGYFPDFIGETLIIAADMDAVSQRLLKAIDAGEQAVVLASGDPLCYGIGTTLLRTLPAESLEIVPAPTAFQMAFAALRESWHDAHFLSAHARPLADVVQQTRWATKVAILTDPQQTPAVIAQALMDDGMTGHTPCAICENLGGVDERIVRTTLQIAAQETFASLNVFVIWPVSGDNQPIQLSTGLSDDAFITSRGQITKREIRLLTIAELDVQAGDVVWDIGAGSGSVSIEIARSQPTARVYAIERRAEFIAHIDANCQRHQTDHVQIVHGSAPDDCTEWPAPNAVFIGGSGGKLAEIIAFAREGLCENGRLVCNLATLENLAQVRALLPNAQVSQVQVSRGVPIGEMMRLQPLNPIFMIKWTKQNNVNKSYK